MHTPAPWSFNRSFEDEYNNYFAIKAGEGFHSNTENTGFGLTGFISEPNVRLIANAPELLENLMRLVDRIEEAGIVTKFPSAYRRAKEAIAKATKK